MPYFITFALSTFFAYRAHKAKSREMVIFYSLLAVLLPSLLGGIRHVRIGNDTGGYALRHYEAAVSASSFGEFLLCDRRLSRELGWAVLTYVSSKIFEHSNWNLFIYEIITLSFTYAALYRHKNAAPIYFSWLVFLLTNYAMIFNYMRQGMAASIIFFGFTELENKHYKNFSLYIIAAILFHSSAFVVVIYFLGVHYFMYSINYLERHQKLKNLIIYSSLILLSFTRYLMSVIVSFVPFLSYYTGFWNVQRIGYATNGLYFGEIAMFKLYPKGLRRLFSKGDMYKFWTFSVILNFLYRSFVGIFSRIFYYFEYIHIMLLASLPFLVKEKNLRIIMAFIVISVCLLYFFVIYVFFRVAQTGVWPYRTFFD